MVFVEIAKSKLMKELIQYLCCIFIALNLVACGSKESHENNTSTQYTKTIQEPKEITPENLKNSKAALLQQMANELYLETEKEIQAAPKVEMDIRGIYDNIEPVEVEIDSSIHPNFELEIDLQEEPEKILKD